MAKKAVEQTGLIPRSIIRTFDRFRKQLFPEAEKLIIQEFRISRYQLLVSAKCLASLVFIPLIVNFFFKNFLLIPLTENLWNNKQSDIFLNVYQQNKAFNELQKFQEKLYFDYLINNFDIKQVELKIVSQPACLFFQNWRGLDLKSNKKKFCINNMFNVFYNALSNSVSYPTRETNRYIVQIRNTSQTLNDIKVLYACPGSQKLRTGFAGKNNTLSREKSLKSLTEGKSARHPFFNRDLHLPSFVRVLYTWSIFDIEPNRKQIIYEIQRPDLLYLHKHVKLAIIKNGTSKLNCFNRIVSSTTCQARSDLPLKKQVLAVGVGAKRFPIKRTWPFVKNGVQSTWSNSNLTLKSIPGFDYKEIFHFFNLTRVTTRHTISSRPINTLFKSGISGCGTLDLNVAQFEIRNSILKYRIQISNNQLFQQDEIIKKLIKDKIFELAIYYNQQSILALVNLISDFVTFLVITIVIIYMKPQISILKSFLTESIYSLNDTKKSFLLILGTDLLVGFHSPRGWEICLELILRHFGLPENKDFVFLFVASFPVLLDTVFKYWIFRYLNKISPSTVATYHSMIE